jgi:hypothetical protein
MKLTEVLKLIGAGVTAGVTGGYLALKMRQPRKSYSDFLRVYASLSVDFIRRLEYSFVETMVPEIAPENRPDLEALLDRSATFNEKMRFFQQRISGFDEAALKAIGRFYQSKGGSLGGSSLEGRVIEFSGKSTNTGVDQLFAHLEEAFDLSISTNIPADRKTEWLEFLDQNPGSTLVERLRFYEENFPRFGGVLFDAISRFESKIYTISLP